MENNTNAFPIPGKELWTRRAGYFGTIIGVGALAVAGIILVGPSVLLAINTLIGLGYALLALGGVALAGTVLWYIASKAIPVAKLWIDSKAYDAWNQIMDNYPLVHIGLWHQKVLEGIKDTEQAKKELSGIVGENQGSLDEINTRINELVIAIKDPRTSLATREECTEELATKREIQKPYQHVVDQLTPAIQMFEMFLSLQRKYAQKLEREMEVASAEFRAKVSLDRGQQVQSRALGDNTLKVNAEMARKRIKLQLGNSLGRLEDVRQQMGVIAHAAATQNEIALANAKQFVEAQLREIEVPVVEAVPVANDRKSLLKLN